MSEVIALPLFGLSDARVRAAQAELQPIEQLVLLAIGVGLQLGEDGNEWAVARLVEQGLVWETWQGRLALTSLGAAVAALDLRDDGAPEDPAA